MEVTSCSALALPTTWMWAGVNVSCVCPCVSGTSGRYCPWQCELTASPAVQTAVLCQNMARCAGGDVMGTALVGVRQNSEWMKNWGFYLKIEWVHSENVVLKWGGMDASQLGYRAVLCLNKLALLLCFGVALWICLCSYRLYRDQGMPFLINNHSSLMY